MSNRIDRVVITGASSGIGLDLARRFLAEGSSLVLNGRDPEKLERARRSLDGGRRVVAVPGHVGDPATARAVAAAAQEHWDGVDVLVNNAGIFGVKPFLESTADDLERFFTTNVKGTYLMTQAIVPLMIEVGGGSIVNVGTPFVYQAKTTVPISAAMASKGGVHALTGNLAIEFAPDRIRVNAIAPGVVETPLFDPILTREQLASFNAFHPLGRNKRTVWSIPLSKFRGAHFGSKSQNTIVGGVNLQDHPSRGGQRCAIILCVSAVRGADRNQSCPCPRHDVRHAERAADFDQFAARDNGLAAVRERVERQKDSRRIIIDDSRVFRTRQAA